MLLPDNDQYDNEQSSMPPNVDNYESKYVQTTNGDSNGSGGGRVASTNGSNNNWVGIINKKFSPKQLVETSGKLATRLCLDKYGVAPRYITLSIKACYLYNTSCFISVVYILKRVEILSLLNCLLIDYRNLLKAIQIKRVFLLKKIILAISENQKNREFNTIKYVHSFSDNNRNISFKRNVQLLFYTRESQRL